MNKYTIKTYKKDAYLFLGRFGSNNNKLFINGIEGKETESNEWLKFENAGEVKTVEKQVVKSAFKCYRIRDEYKNICFGLKDTIYEIDGIPEKIKEMYKKEYDSESLLEPVGFEVFIVIAPPKVMPWFARPCFPFEADTPKYLQYRMPCYVNHKDLLKIVCLEIEKRLAEKIHFIIERNGYDKIKCDVKDIDLWSRVERTYKQSDYTISVKDGDRNVLYFDVGNIPYVAGKNAIQLKKNIDNYVKDLLKDVDGIHMIKCPHCGCGWVKGK